MKPQEKAYEIWQKMMNADVLVDSISAKQCSLVAVDEILEFMKMDDDYTETASNANSIWVNYFIEVKKEIEKL